MEYRLEIANSPIVKPQYNHSTFGLKFHKSDFQAHASHGNVVKRLTIHVDAKNALIFRRIGTSYNS